MKYLEIIYHKITGHILTTKIHGKMDTVIPNEYEIKTIPYVHGIRKNLDIKLFNGTELINNPNYKPILTDKEKFKNLKNIDEQIQFIANKLKLIEEEE